MSKKAIHKGYAYFVSGSAFPDMIAFFQCGFLLGSVRSRYSMLFSITGKVGKES